MNSNWWRSNGNPPPQTLIVLREHLDFLQRSFASCKLAGRLANRYDIENSATTGYADVFVCRNPRQPWPEFWEHFRYYG